MSDRCSATISTNRHLSDTEQSITSAFPEVKGDGAMQTNLMEVDSDSTLAKIGPRYSFATTAETDLIHSGTVTIGQIRMCAQEHSNRRLLAKCIPSLSEHTHYQTIIDSKTVDSNEGEGLQVFDTQLERTYTYERDGSGVQAWR